VLNISTGRGTLAHELTHALAHFDFPDMPEWFDEGLASLGEESEFSDDGLRLTGISNWRLNYVLPELRQNRLRPLQSLIVSGNVRPGYEAVDYAHARYFCLYLQQRQLLGPYYRKFRARAASDPSRQIFMIRGTRRSSGSWPPRAISSSRTSDPAAWRSGISTRRR